MSSVDDSNAGSSPLRDRWDARYREVHRFPSAAAVLADNLHLLPSTGDALDLACGLGSNALMMARQGLHVWAWDLSPVAIAYVNDTAREACVSLTAQVRDVEALPPEPNRFDAIVVTHFLDRRLASAIAAALRPGGLLFYQTFTREAVSGDGPSDPAYRLDTNELLQLFPGLILRVYREEGRVGDCRRGTRDLAQMVAQRRG